MPQHPDPRIDALARRLAGGVPARVPDRPADHSAGAAAAGREALASVALVVRPQPTDLDILLIRRAVFAGDPWSGHMALPGGRRAPEDPDGRSTAVRETREEVGIDLQGGGAGLGRLDDVRPGPRAPRIVVSPFVFAVPRDTDTTPNHEVDLAVWVPLRRLLEPDAATDYLHALASGESLRFPALGYQDHVIWGLTYRILSQFLEIARSAGAGRHP